MELIIFDVDGTLVHSDKRDSKTFANTYEKVFGHPFPTIDWRRFPHVTDNIIFTTAYNDHFQRQPTRSEIASFQTKYIDALRVTREDTPEAFQEVEGARAAVEKLQKTDRLIGVGTGGWKMPAHLKLSHVGIAVDDQLFTGGDGMPTREAILEKTIKAAEQIAGRSLTRVVYFGDAAWDVTTTRNMQIDFVGVRRGGDLDSLHKLGARTVIQDFSDLNTLEMALATASPPKKY